MDPSVFFDHIVSHIEKGLPLAVFRMPHSEEVVAYLQSDLSHQTPETLSEGFLIAPFQSTDAFIAIRNDNIIKTNFAAADSDKVSLTPQWKGIDVKEQLHIGLVNNALQAINRTALNKVVLATSLKHTLADHSLLVYFTRILERYHNTFNFWFSHPVCGTWMGATPELLLSMKGNQLRTMALAGTRKQGGSEWGQKEIEEQSLVLSEIKHTLSNLPSGFSNLTTAKTQTKKAGAIEHILTQISAEVYAPPLEVAKALHPTPAVGGVPKIEAIDFIESQEKLSRSYYSGFLGPFTKGKADWFVNLRSMRLKSKEVEIFVGAGITADSDPQSEWEELMQKAQTMGSIIGD